jgi:hypothetical protein
MYMSSFVIRRGNCLAIIAVAGVLLLLALATAAFAAGRTGFVAFLNAQVGSGAKIGVTKDPEGRVVQLAPGSYEIRVRDRSSRDNFHLIGPLVNRRTSVSFSGAVTWRLRLARGLYRYRSDPHPKTMRGSIRVE